MPPVPYYSKSKYVKPYLRKQLTMKQRMEVSKIIKRYEKIVSEPKRYVIATSVSVIAGNGYIINPLYNISQGTTMLNRVANRIKLDSVTFNLELENDLASGKPVDYGIYAFWSDEEISTLGTWAQVPNGALASTLPLLGSTSAGLVSLNQLDISQCKPIMEVHADVPQYITGNGLKCFKKAFNFRGRTIQYLLDAASFLQGQNLYFLVVGDAPGATVGTTTIGALRCNYQVKFHE